MNKEKIAFLLVVANIIIYYAIKNIVAHYKKNKIIKIKQNEDISFLYDNIQSSFVDQKFIIILNEIEIFCLTKTQEKCSWYIKIELCDDLNKVKFEEAIRKHLQTEIVYKDKVGGIILSDKNLFIRFLGEYFSLALNDNAFICIKMR